MRTTRAQAYASHCIITRVPVEIVTQILKYDGLSRRDHAAVAKTCRYLRAIATPLLFQSILIVADKKASFAPLEAIAGSPENGALVRSVDITEPEKAIASSRAVIYSGILVSALGAMSSLTTLAIPFALLNLDTFDAVYKLPSIGRLLLSRVTLTDHVPQYARRTAFAGPRGSTLVVPWLSCSVWRDPSHSMVNTSPILDTLEFLHFHGVAVKQIRLSMYHSDAAFGTFLTAHPFASIAILSVNCNSRTFHKTVAWMTSVLNVQELIETVCITVADRLHGFELGRNSWAGWADGQAVYPFQELGAAWQGVQARNLSISFFRPEPKEDLITTHVEVTLAGATVVSARRVRALVDQEPCAFAFCFFVDHIFAGPGLHWPEWPSTVEALVTHRFSETCQFFTSVTPTPTMYTTVACSPTCYTKLSETHPALHAATELVGGPAALWTLAVNLNIERLRMLEEGPRDYVLEVEMHIVGKGGNSLVDVEGEVAVRGPAAGGEGVPRKLNLVAKGIERPDEDKLLDCECFVCAPLRTREAMEDPVSALRRCGVDEVRAALAIGGFDLDAFDNRQPTEPVDPGSFETFLRRTT